MEPVRLEGERILLRELSAADLAAVRNYVSDPEAIRYLHPIPTAEQDTRDWLERVATQAQVVPRRRWDLAIEVGGGEVAGAIGLTAHDGGTASIGWVLRRSYWGRGLATDAARLLSDHAFETLGVRRLRAECDVRNRRSQRVMEKLFMRREGHMVADGIDESGGYRSSYSYALLADERREWLAFPRRILERAGLQVTVERPGDVKEINELQRRVGRDMNERYGMDHWTEPYDLGEMQADARRRETYAVRDAAGAMIASFTIGLSPMWLSEETMAWPAADQPLWLHRLMVAPEHQGSGLGGEIMALCERMGRARRCDVLRLETRADFDAVQRFYARHGYTEVWRSPDGGKHAPWNALNKSLL